MNILNKLICRCVKEIHGIVGDNEKYPCKDKGSCEIAAEADKFSSVDWSTHVVNG